MQPIGGFARDDVVAGLVKRARPVGAMRGAMLSATPDDFSVKVVALFVRAPDPPLRRTRVAIRLGDEDWDAGLVALAPARHRSPLLDRRHRDARNRRFV